MSWLAATILDECQTSTDCMLQNQCVAGYCEHKSFWPPSGLDIALGAIICILTGLANAAGIAGGSIIIPIVITVGGFTTHQTIPIVITAIIGGAVVAAVFRLQVRHLAGNKPRIDFDIALHLMVPVLMGTVFGVMANAVTPEWLILALLVITLTYTTYNVFSKAISLHRMQGVASAMKPLIDAHSSPSPELAAIFKEEEKLAPGKHLSMIFAIFIFVTVFAFLRGGKGVASILGFQPCSQGYWITTGSFVVLSLLISDGTSRFLLNKDARYEAVGYPFDKHDFRWTITRCRVLVGTGILSGFAAGLLGLAGGVILAPFLLALNMRPEVANATCSFMVFFMCATTFLQFATAGMVSFDYGLAYCLLTALGSLIGVTVIEAYIKKMQSIVVFLLGVVVAITTVLVPVYGIRKVMWQLENNGVGLSFKDFC